MDNTHEMCNSPCPTGTPKDNRRQYYNTSTEDAENRSKHSTRSTLQSRCMLVGAPKPEMPTQRSCAVWSPQPPSALPQDSVIRPPAPHITDRHIYLGHSNLHQAFSGFWPLHFARGRKFWRFQGWLNGAFKNCCATEKQQNGKCHS